MEMVGFTPEKQRRLFAVLSAVLLLGKVKNNLILNKYVSHFFLIY